jgi:hypothetical protein
VRALALIGLAIPLLVSLATAPRALAAAGPYEPNDSIPSAAGPLLIDQSYLAGIETPGDRDYFFFYVTSPRLPQITLTVKNLGGGSATSDLDATILDSAATPLSALAYLGDGESRSLALALLPQKYFVEVAPSEGFGDSYSLTTAGGEGAFGPYAQIAGRCATAKAATAATKSSLQRAEGKLQRATARLQRSRYAGPDARKRAHAVYRKAKARLTAKAHALKAARKSQEPWCFIPQ